MTRAIIIAASYLIGYAAVVVGTSLHFGPAIGSIVGGLLIIALAATAKA